MKKALKKLFELANGIFGGFVIVFGFFSVVSTAIDMLDKSLTWEQKRIARCRRWYPTKFVNKFIDFEENEGEA